MTPVVGTTHLVEEVRNLNHRLRLDKLPKHNQLGTKGIYRVKLSSNHYLDSTLTWRAVLDDYDRECKRNGIGANNTRKNKRLETLAKIHYRRQKQDAARRKEEDDLAKSHARRVKEIRLRQRRQINNDVSTQTSPTSSSRDTTISQDQIGSDQVSSRSHSSSPSSKQSIDSEHATVSDVHSESEDQSTDSPTTSPTRSKASPDPIPPFTEEVMLSLPGRHESMTYSPNNTGTLYSRPSNTEPIYNSFPANNDR